MINTILFDLDGTVLPMDLDAFMQRYFHEMGKMFHDMIDGRLLAKYVMESTSYMVSNLEDRLNEDKFMARFSQLIGADITVYRKRFDAFYDTLFLNVRETTQQNDSMIKAIRLIKNKGYNAVLATNPLFPMKANHHRIRWAGLSPEDFSYISSFESNRYCKPNPEYYREVLSAIDRTADECMMVGNDALEDLAAAKLGIKTYLIENHLLNPHHAGINADHRGSYEDFYAFVRALPEAQDRGR
ncbi:MAG: HAD family hydrolase [Candidatus Neomarinimicrobiota bacterium]|jgi:FMN phosphatase YigB (HAD superfamily)|nr:HAD family hydrolase [Candidatus Neomarinimicrobiota bacterium]MDX9780408.1 HAD family hydrolase [bacterium]